MARKPNKHDISIALAIDGTDDSEILNGRNDEDDVINGGGGNDTIDGLQGVDMLTGGAGADTFHLYWFSSNVTYGVDTITDFEAADFIDLQTITTHYSEADLLVATTRALDFGDVTLEPIAGGNILHVEVVAGDPTWDVTMVILGETPTEAQFVFA